MIFITRLLNIGITDKLTPYERRRASVFNYCNLAGIVIASLRLLYLSFSSINHYSTPVLLVNAIPLVLCISMAVCMVSNVYKSAIAISFIFFPPTIMAMAFMTGDGGMEVYLFLYLMFTFFFLHDRNLIIATFCWIIACFVMVHFPIQRFTLESQYPYRQDFLLSILDYSSGLIFIFLTMYFIKYQVWKFEKSIREKKEELRRLNSVKDKVFSVIAHDLRLPIHSIILLLREMDKSGVSHEEFSLYLQDLLTNMEQTGDLMDNLLAWARSQIQQTELNVREISIAKLSQQTIRFLERHAAQKNIRLINEIPSMCFARADESSAKIVLRNLMANAIKFTDSGGYVKVKSESVGGFINIIVEDNGIGIHPDKQSLLFGEQYYSTLGTNKEVGTGLGLLICKDLVQKNGGDLMFTSQLGAGSKFSFSLPIQN